MGSSCFSRGNKKTVGFIQNYLKEKGLTDEVSLKGAHCMGECDKGPLMEIDGQLIHYTTETMLQEILDNKLGLTTE